MRSGPTGRSAPGATGAELAALFQAAPSPVVGVDCGGSGSRAVVIAEGAVVRRWELGPLHAILGDDTSDRLAEVVRSVGAPLAGIGLAGVRAASGATDREAPGATHGAPRRVAPQPAGDPLRREGRGAQALADVIAAACQADVVVCSDVEAARAGAFSDSPGIAVVAGTGSAAYGIDATGRVAAAGGHGYLLGDEGGGYWIGREAVRAALAARDGLGPATELSALLVKATGQTLDQLVTTVHRHGADRSILARLAPIVTASTDPVAAGITSAAGRALARLAGALTTRLGPLPVAGIGGVFAAPLLWQSFCADCDTVEPRFDPAVGAALLAVRGWRQLGAEGHR